MRILLAEDDIRLGRAVKRVFEEEGYDVTIAVDGNRALSLASSTDFDVVILDIILPEKDGFEICRELRQAGVETPVLMMTGRTEVEDRVQGLDAGADDYMVKPFELDELLARVRSLIRRAAHQPHPALFVGDVRIDTVARDVTLSGEPVSLSPKEYALVEFLARRRGQLVTREMIYEHLYDEHEDTLSNVVDVYISNIRKRVGREFVRTRRGEGYIVDA